VGPGIDMILTFSSGVWSHDTSLGGTVELRGMHSKGSGLPGMFSQKEVTPAAVEAEDESSALETGADIVTDFIPIVGGAKDIYKGIRDGNGWQIALGVGGLILDVATLGTGSLIKGGVKTAIKQGVKAAAEQGVKEVAEQGAKEFSERAFLQRVANKAERNVGGAGKEAGIVKHKYAKNLIERYQSLYGEIGLKPETSYLKIGPKRPEFEQFVSGSVRPDVISTVSNRAYDFKFTKFSLERLPVIYKKQAAKILLKGPRSLTGVDFLAPSSRQVLRQARWWKN
jgi:hypothetical protein